MGFERTTNNRMELLAVIEALALLKRPCEVHIYTDSQYVQKGMSEWIAGWKQRGWRTAARQEVKNVDLWKRLDAAVFGGVPADNDTLATADASFCVLSGADLHSLLRKYPELSLKIIADLSLRLKDSETQIESLTLKKAEDRLLHALFDYAGGKTSFKLQLSKKDIASQIGMRPETLSRSLQQLQQKGVIEMDGKSIKLLVPRRDL